MRSFILGLGLAVFLSAAAPRVAAADPDGDKPAVEAVDGRRMELAARYLELTVTEAMNKSMGVLMDQLLKEAEDSSEAEQAWAREQFPGMMTDMVGTIVERMAPIYAERLSIAELEALVGFFETPMGRSISRRLVEASLDQEEILADVVFEGIAEYEAKYCAVFDCEAPALNAAPQKDGY